MTRVAYLVSRYPTVSHTFVRREVAALRAVGIEVDTYSVRHVGADQVLADDDRRAFESTTALVPPDARSLVRVTRAAITRPSATARLLRLAIERGRRSPKLILWQLFYAVEAMLLWSRCRSRQVTHVHAHFANVGADVARLAARFGGDEWSWSFTMHGPTELSDVGRFDLAAKVADAAFVVCISDFCRSQLMALVEEDRWSKLHVVHCGIEPDRLPLADRDDRDGRDGRDRTRLLCVGRLVPEKGQAVLLDALEILRQRGIAVETVLVGDGPRRAALERRAASSGLDVSFAGAVAPDAVVQHYRWADVFCLPSFAEGVPVVLMEAMATGAPVITTRIAGIAELVEDGETGVLLPPGRADLLADAIERLAADPALRRKMGEAGRAIVLEQFDVRASATQLAQLFAATA